MEGARPATSADVPRLGELCRMALAELDAYERGGPLYVVRDGRPDPAEDGLRAEIDDPDAVVVAGTFDEHVFGFATGRVQELRDGRRLGVIGELFVEPEARAVGVGEAMMDELLVWFRGRGCLGVDAVALPGARQTKNFFEESGFTARLLVMHHRLEE
ncbi:MAG TPA: GNAT family N-acetyltransferase [Dermatophilaceae bacterium]|nr:GNAT family N-acetyltransferase [Dermatophilaceae bacterium]